MSSRADFPLNSETPQHYGLEAALTYIWDVPTLAWVKSTGGGGGGGAVTIADGADVAEGSTGDAAWVAGAGTVISLLKTIASSGAAAGLTDAQLRATPVPVSGTVTALLGRGATGTETNVAASATNVTLLASNANRLGAACFNDSTSALYLKLGATASATSFTVKVFAGGYYEIPVPVYTGIIDGLWDSATGSARVTEISV